MQHFSFIVGVTQRNHSSYFPFLDAQKTDILADILSFFNEKIAGNFPDDDCK